MRYFNSKCLAYMIVACLLGNAGIGQDQSPIKIRNLYYLDSMEHIYRDKICTGPVSYEHKYGAKKMRGELAVIGLLNNAFAKRADIKAILATTTKLRSVRATMKKQKNGLLKTDIIVLNSTYLHVKLVLETIDDVIVRKECTLSTVPQGTCDVSQQPVTDFKLLKEVVAREIDFPIKLVDMRFTMVHDFLSDQVASLSDKHADYQFYTGQDTGEPDWVNRIYRNQYNSDSSCCYQFNVVHKSFRALLQQGKTEVLKTLLFSPNYFFAVNAMESLIYLSSLNKIALDDRMKQKIEAIKQGRSPIMVRQTFDVFQYFTGYSALGMEDSKIVDKYRNTVQ